MALEVRFATAHPHRYVTSYNDLLLRIAYQFPLTHGLCSSFHCPKSVVYGPSSIFHCHCPLLQGGTATVIDRSDYGWKTHKHKLYSMNDTGPAPDHYLHVDSAGLLKANGGVNSDNIFTVYTQTVGSKVVVMLEHDSTKKVVAISTNSDEVCAKTLPVGTTLSQFNNLSTAKASEPNILFHKKPRTPGSEHFHLQSYLDAQKRVGFDPNGNPMPPSNVNLQHPASLFKMYTS